jgi:hypothetical protein
MKTRRRSDISLFSANQYLSINEIHSIINEYQYKYENRQVVYQYCWREYEKSATWTKSGYDAPKVHSNSAAGECQEGDYLTKQVICVRGMAGIKPTPSQSNDWTPLLRCQLSQGGENAVLL